METGSRLDILENKDEPQEMGACYDGLQCWFAGDLDCEIWPEDGMSRLGGFTLTLRLKRSGYQEYAVQPLGPVVGG